MPTQTILTDIRAVNDRAAENVEKSAGNGIQARSVNNIPVENDILAKNPIQVENAILAESDIQVGSGIQLANDIQAAKDI